MYEPPITWSAPSLTPKLPRDIRIHYVPLDPNSLSPSHCQYKATALATPLLADTPYTIKGAWGCSPNNHQPVSQVMRVHIYIPSEWTSYVVAGKDLLP